MKRKIISTDISKGSQDINVRQVFEAHGQKCKIDIKLDSYVFQSYARVYVWQKDKLEWSLVDSIHPESIALKGNDLYYSRQVLVANTFALIIEPLLVKLNNILG